MIELGPVSLAFLGHRSYLHSTNLFRSFLDQLEALGPSYRPTLLHTYKFLRETDRNGRAFLTSADGIPAARTACAATIDYCDAANRHWRYHFVDDGEPIVERRPDRAFEGRIEGRTGDFSGIVRFAGILDADAMFAALVEGNKRLHAATIAARGAPGPSAIRYLYCENLTVDVPALGADLAVTYRLVGERLAGGKGYTLADAMVDGWVSPAARLCFAF